MNTILAVDDAPDSLLLLEFDLQAEGYVVLTANDGQTALDILSSESIDLILLDLYMPGISGLDTLKMIKSMPEHAEKPVIMLSASDDENEIVAALELGANDYITKPYIPKVLLARLKTSLRLWEKTLTLENLAKTDFLTGLNNKRSFEDLTNKTLKHMSREQQDVCVAIFDIDFFKQVNDNYGHDVGDDVLKVFATTLKTTLRDYDVIGRVGGEEFAVCMPNSSLQEGFNVCERFRESIEQLNYMTSCGTSLSLTVSIGLSTVNTGEGRYDFVSLMKAADQFLYQAKDNGRNRTETYQPMEVFVMDEEQPIEPRQVSSKVVDALPGIDYTIGVNNVLGDDDLFKEILQMFYDDHSGDGNKLHQAISTRDSSSLKHVIHTLKGVACSIGAMTLFEHAKQLDIAANDNLESEYEGLFISVNTELNRVLEGIKIDLKIDS